MTKKTAAKKKKSTTTTGPAVELGFERFVTGLSNFLSQPPAPAKPHVRHFKVRLPSGAEAEHEACGFEVNSGTLVFTTCVVATAGNRLLIAYAPGQWFTVEELPEVVAEPAVPAEPPAPVVQA